jgi:septum formation protein
MSRRPVVLASASPARLKLLREAGLDPVVIISGVDETDVEATDPSELVATLAVRKAVAVAERRSGSLGVPPEALVIGCDSMLYLDGEIAGKPATAEAAMQRWLRMRGRHGVLLTGHCVIDTATGARAVDTATTTVRFGSPSERELSAYIATGEPLAVAGAFTLDGYSSPFIDGIDGDPGNVIGLSLPLLRKLLADLGVGIVELWR